MKSTPADRRSGKSRQILLLLIHHNDSARTGEARRVSEAVRDAIADAGYSPIPSEIHAQGDIDHPIFDESGLMRIVRTQLTQRRFVHQERRRRQLMNLGNSTSGTSRRDQKRFPDWVVDLPKLAWRLLRRVDRAALARQHRIERILTDKHIHAWTSLSNSAAVGAVVLEDDARVRSDTSPVSELLSVGVDDFDFIDLAGGFSFADLGFPDAVGGDLELPGVLTNTTCGYFVSRRLALLLVAMAQERMRVGERLPVDFLMNYVNHIPGVADNLRTLLPGRPPLEHGSMRDGTSSIRPD